MRKDWEKRKLYLKAYYEDSMTIYEIAEKYGKNPSTISRTIARAERLICPFCSDCLKCSLPDCAIKEEYAVLVNQKAVDKRRIDQ